MPKMTNKKNAFNMKAVSGVIEVLLYNDIGMWGITAENFRNSLSGLSGKKKLLKVNSYGGEVFDGFAIYNSIKEDAENWEAEIDGVAASISSIIPLAAKTVRMRSNAMIMIHNPSVGIWGDENDLRKEADVLKKLKDNAIEIYAAKMPGWSKEDISALMDDETWYTAKEALSVGLIDEIIDPAEIEEPETNRSNKLPSDMAKSVFVNYKPATKLPDKEPVINKGASMNKCPHCGKEHPESMAFCGACGKPMDQATAQRMASERERNEAVAAERERVKNITALASKHNLEPSFVDELINKGESYELCAVKILEKIEIPSPVNHGGTKVIKDGSDKFVDHAVNCIAVAAGYETDSEKIRDARKDVMVGHSIHTLMRIDLQNHGVDTSRMDPEQLYRKSISMFGTGSSDLPLVFEAASNKSMAKGYTEAPTTYQIWTGRREVPDFKTQKLVSVSNFGDVKDLPEGSDFEDSKISDARETFSISTKGRKFTVSRQAFINDDMEVFTKIPFGMGRAIARRINKDVYDKLTYNTLVGPLMGDGVALFNLASHYNLIATSGVVSATSLDASERKLLDMPLLAPENGAQVQRAGLTGKYLITGTTNKLSILQVLGSNGMDISKSIVGVYNPYNLNNTIPVFDPYLQSLLTAASKANAWYHVADQMDAETIGVAFLRGNTVPTMRREESRVGEALGLAMDIFADWGIYIADWRGIIHNDGASG